MRPTEQETAAIEKSVCYSFPAGAGRVMGGGVIQVRARVGQEAEDKERLWA